VSLDCEHFESPSEKLHECFDKPFVCKLSGRSAPHGFIRTMLVEMPLESIERGIQHSGGIEMPTVDDVGFDRLAGPFDQPFGPWMIRLLRLCCLRLLQQS
jgi:hypothetical protein